MIDHKLLKKKEKTVPTRGGGRNFILAAKSLIYKQTSSAFNQIWSRVWGLRMGLLSPQDVGRSPQKAQRPLPRLCCLNTKYQTSLSSLPPTRSLFPRNGPSHLTCSCQSASSEEVSSPGQLGASSRGRRRFIAAPTEQQDAPSPLRFGRLPPPREKKTRSQSAPRL